MHLRNLSKVAILKVDEGKEESLEDQNTNKVATARKLQCDH